CPLGGFDLGARALVHLWPAVPPLSVFVLPDPSTAAISTLSLHDALPIFESVRLLQLDEEVVDSDDVVSVAGEGGADDVVGINDLDRKSTRLNSSHVEISYAVFCLKKKKEIEVADCGDGPVGPGNVTGVTQ